MEEENAPDPQHGWNAAIDGNVQVVFHPCEILLANIQLQKKNDYEISSNGNRILSHHLDEFLMFIDKFI